ncbi:MAG TPA: erythromycin esterase family protein [Thermoanaerobaculia bacterium]|nr:erythromycin esterase family protein [Thermoanaerobaculia bacterium]
MKKLRWTQRLSIASIMLLMTAFSAGAQPLAPEPGFDAARKAPGFPVGPGIWKLHGVDPELGTADLEPLRKLVGKASVVGLGESYHATSGLYVLKHRVFRFLVEKMGFRVLAFETNWQGAEVATRYVETCEGTPEEALQQLHNVWQGTEVSELLQWMCGWNRDHPSDKVAFFGFDIQEPWRDGGDLIAFLGRIGIPGGHAWAEGVRSCEQVTTSHPWGQIPQAIHDQCIQALGAIEAHFRSSAEEIRRRVSAQDLEKAKLMVVAVRANQNAVFRMPHDFASGFNPRDEAMAHVFQTLRAQRFPNARTVIWAADIHVARSRLPRGERPMGSHLAAALGRGYVNFANTAYETDIDFPGFGCGRVDRTPGSVEDRLHKIGEEIALIDLARSSILKRGTYTMGIYRFRPHKDFTGIFFHEHSGKMDPVGRPPC